MRPNSRRKSKACNSHPLGMPGARWECCWSQGKKNPATSSCWLWLFFLKIQTQISLIMLCNKEKKKKNFGRFGEGREGWGKAEFSWGEGRRKRILNTHYFVTIKQSHLIFLTKNTHLKAEFFLKYLCLIIKISMDKHFC